mmetsp:Transcript_90065/g.263309  ORF Transcript_90065/g.263309 Transcript_90065/m.263309 type:complete len:361 (-) Transcript_90065:35-1117(-)
MGAGVLLVPHGVAEEPAHAVPAGRGEAVHDAPGVAAGAAHALEPAAPGLLVSGPTTRPIGDTCRAVVRLGRRRDRRRGRGRGRAAHVEVVAAPLLLRAGPALLQLVTTSLAVEPPREVGHRRAGVLYLAAAARGAFLKHHVAGASAAVGHAVQVVNFQPLDAVAAGRGEARDQAGNVAVGAASKLVGAAPALLVGGPGLLPRRHSLQAVVGLVARDRERRRGRAAHAVAVAAPLLLPARPPLRPARAVQPAVIELICRGARCRRRPQGCARRPLRARLRLCSPLRGGRVGATRPSFATPCLLAQGPQSLPLALPLLAVEVLGMVRARRRRRGGGGAAAAVVLAAPGLAVAGPPRLPMQVT